jgi:hypothetical protein
VRRYRGPLLTALALGLALASYWLAWVSHPAAGLTIAAVDFAEFPKFMPQVRSGSLAVWREAFYMPLFALGLALAVWTGVARDIPGEPWSRWVIRAAAVFLPLTPSVFNVLESGELQTQVRLAAAIAAAVVLAPVWRRLPLPVVFGLLAGCFIFGGAAPAVQFLQMKPAIDEIYRQAPALGPGFWIDLAAFGVLGILSLVRALRPA